MASSPVTDHLRTNAQPSSPTLVRAIGRWSLTAMVVNGVIGSGIFGLPSSVAGFVGTWSPVAVLLGGVCISTVILCFAEVGSRYDEAGGPYLYTREAFGPAAGFQIGWLHLWTRIFSGAAALNVLVSYVAALVPPLGTSAGRTLVMTLGMAVVTGINVAGVRQSAWTVNVFTVAKLLPLVLLGALGAFHLNAEIFATQAVARPNWPEAVLLLVFAYGGFESSVVAAAETRDPKRDTAFALIAGMCVITVVYAAVQLVVVGVLPHAAASQTPVASALGQLLGHAGIVIGALAVVLSLSGWLTAFALMTPRIMYAMALRGELPAVIGRVHPTFRTPYVAITINSIVGLAIGLAGAFTQLATVAAIVRLAIFASTCGALIVLRRSAGAAPFQVPGGPAVAVVGIAFCVWMLSTRSFSQAWPLVAVIIAGLALWVSVGRQRRA
jgi:APA family basic amino acid/polyamine antiporter